MSSTSSKAGSTGGGGQREHVSAMQRLLDNPFLLLFLGIAFPTVFYIVWGIMEVATLPVAP